MQKGHVAYCDRQRLIEVEIGRKEVEHYTLVNLSIPRSFVGLFILSIGDQLIAYMYPHGIALHLRIAASHAHDTVQNCKHYCPYNLIEFAILKILFL